MKRRLLPIVTFSIALILAGSLAYAADRRKHAKPADKPADRIAEEEALRVELLDSSGDQDKKVRDAGDTGKIVDKRSNEKTDRKK
jgi:hypothetical protein